MKNDLLAVPLMGRVLLSRYMPLVFQVFGLMLFAWVIYDGFFGAQILEENFSTLGVWVLFFWPVILLSLVFMGRAWCAACPMGSLTAFAGKWTRGLSFPRSLQNTGISLTLFLLVLWILRPIMGISNSPAFTAWFFVIWAIAALTAGFFYASRAFCRFICPIAAPLSVLARVAPVELRAKHSSKLNPVCSECRGHECYKGSSVVGGCPAGEFPAIMNSNGQCTFCLKCLKSCPTKGQLQIRLRWPFMELTRISKPLVIDSLTTISLAGIFLWHMAIGHEPRMPQFFMSWSNQIHQFATGMQHDDIAYLITFACALLAMGSLFAAMAFVTARIAKLSFKKSLAISSYAFLALVAFRALGYMAGDIITKGGDILNYLGSSLGIHIYYPSSLVSWAFRPLLNNTGYHLYGLLLTVPLLIGLLLSWFLIFKTWQQRGTTVGQTLLLSIPSIALATLIVAVYEWFYLVGYRVIHL